LELIAAKGRSDLLSRESRLALGVKPRRSASGPTTASEAASFTAGAPIILNKATTLYPGDCHDVLKHIPNDTIDVVIVDPPFYLDVPADQTVIDYYIAKNGMKPRFRQAWDKFANADDYLRFSESPFEQVQWITAPTGSLFVFTVHNNLGLVDLAVRRAGLTVLHHVVWAKRNPTPVLSTRRLQFAHETIIWCVKTQDYLLNYRSLKASSFEGDRFKSTGRQHRDIIEASTSNAESVGHPAQKPVAVYCRLLEIAGRQGGVLLDPLAGSGTAAVAAGLHGMRCIMIERDERYIELIKRRVLNTGRGCGRAANDKRKVHLDTAAEIPTN
jgi:modification methylase